MKCPLCNADLQITERSDTEINCCPMWRHAAWLDRAELEKIIEKAIELSGRSPIGSRQAEVEIDGSEVRSRRKHRYRRRHEDDYSQRHKKQGTWRDEFH